MQKNEGCCDAAVCIALVNELIFNAILRYPHLHNPYVPGTVYYPLENLKEF